MITYAGVPLATPLTEELKKWLEVHYNPEDSTPWDEPITGKNRYYYTVAGSPEVRRVKLGTLFWPRGASRWAVGYFLASRNELNQVRAKIAAQGTPAALPLVLSDGKRSITTNLWMLPARPIEDIPGTNGLFLITLVDDRYYWWFNTPGFIDTHTGSTTWLSVIQQIQTALQTVTPSLTINVDPIPAAYVNAGKNLTSRYEALPPTLDTAAYNCGHRLVRRLDGTVLVQSVTNARTQLNANLALLRPVEAGGFLAVDGVRPQDTAGIFPQAVQVTFPIRNTNVPLVTVQPVVVTLASLVANGNTPELASVKTNPQTKTFHETGFASFTGSTWNNQTDCTNLATQIATDWYRYQTANTNFVFAGIAPWIMEGLSDAIEWTHIEGVCHTRIHRKPFNDPTEELLHSLPGGLSLDQYPTNSLLVRYADNSLVIPTTMTISLDTATFSLTNPSANEAKLSVIGSSSTPASWNWTGSQTVTWTGAAGAVWNVNGPLTINYNSTDTFNYAGSPINYTGNQTTTLSSGVTVNWAASSYTSQLLYTGPLQIQYGSTVEAVFGGGLSLGAPLFPQVNRPPAWTTNQNDLAASLPIQYVNPTSPVYLGGVVPTSLPNGTADGEITWWTNVGTANLTVKHQATTSLAANRIITPNGLDQQVPPNHSFGLMYDNTLSKHHFVWPTNPVTPLTTKGDLLAFDGTNYQRVAAGTNGQVLQAQSGASSGIQWATPSASAGTAVQTADVTVTNTITETSLIGTGVGSMTIPANTIVAGQSYLFTLAGSGSSSSGVTWRLKVGGQTVDTQTLASFSSGSSWDMKFVITFRAAGASVAAYVDEAWAVDTASTTTSRTRGAQTVTVNTTAAILIDLTAQWGTANTDSITCNMSTLTRLYP